MAALLGLFALPEHSHAQDPLPTAQPLPTATATPRPIAAPLPISTPRPIDLPADIQQTADEQIRFVELQIGQLQADAALSRGRLVQLAPTHPRPPLDVTTPNVLSRVPSEIVTWYNSGVDLPRDMRVAIRVDVYDGPGGTGYVIIAELEHDSQCWRRAINAGPETWREYDWQVEP